MRNVEELLHFFLLTHRHVELMAILFFAIGVFYNTVVKLTGKKI